MTIIYNPRCAVQALEVRPADGMFFFAPHHCMKIRRVSGIMQLIRPVPREQNNDARMANRVSVWDALQLLLDAANSMTRTASILLDPRLPVTTRTMYSEELDKMAEAIHVFRADALTQWMPSKGAKVYESESMSQWLKPDPDSYQ